MEENTIAMLISYYCVGVAMPFSPGLLDSRATSGLGTDVLGQAMSLAKFVEQNGLISPYKYH